MITLSPSSRFRSFSLICKMSPTLREVPWAYSTGELTYERHASLICERICGANPWQDAQCFETWIKALREGYVGCVVCTEIAARGIDAPYLTHVINLDLPTDASHYAHRAGRTGRGGRPGVSVSITCDGREKGVPRRLAEELGITMYNVEARGGKLRIVE